MAAAHFEGCLFVDGFTPDSITPKDSNGLEVPAAGVGSHSVAQISPQPFIPTESFIKAVVVSKVDGVLLSLIYCKFRIDTR